MDPNSQDKHKLRDARLMMVWPGRLRRLYCLALLLSATTSTLADDETPPLEFDPAHAEKMQAGLELFKASVRGILITNCVECHGGEEVQSGFDLATRKGLIRGGAKGAAVVAGKAADSHLVRLIEHREAPHMPDGGDKLPQTEIDAIRQWIDLGAPYDRPLVENPRDPDEWTDTVVGEDARRFWSFQPLLKADPPQVVNAAWVRSPVDHFILAVMEARGLSPAPPADRRTLIRRAYFDLLGLPPTPDEIERFVNDADPKAYESLLDRILESPHYGERWGRHWLDAARFAESNGFEHDYDRPYAFHFRDFVIEALNQDMPFDQFVGWQLAGDEFAPENPLALKATGFLGAGVFPTQITANEVERTRYDALDDMAATTGSALLGLSIGCARCHDHKFDPIPQADYYRFLSTFTTTVRSNLDVNLDPAGYKAAIAAFQSEHAPLEVVREKYEREQLPAKFETWERDHATEYRQQFAWQILDIAEAKSSGGAMLVPQADGSLLASGKNADFDVYTLTAKTELQGVTGIRLEALADPTMTQGGPGRAENGNFDLTDFRVAIQPIAGGEAKPVGLRNPQATFEQPGLLVSFAIDGDKKSGWAVDPQFGKDHAAVFEFAEPIAIEGGVTLTITLEFNGNNRHNLGRPRIAVTTALLPLKVETGGVPISVVAALDTPPDQRSDAQRSALLRWYGKTFDHEWQRLDKICLDHLVQKPQPNTTPIMVCSEGVTPIRHSTQGADFFNETYFLKRGDCDQKMGQASQGFLQVLMTASDRERHWQVAPPEGETTSFRRTALANWITDAEHGAGHLLARVIVNRLWQHHFGRGIVATPNDFGVQGQKPTHPELLDWLANDLIESGWSLKAMHKRMMTTAAYRQSSRFDPINAKLDPENQFLWRCTPRRLEAEIVRDSLLAVSDTLDRTMYGPGSLEETHPRRSIYFMIKRSKLIPMMQLFDQPEPLVSVGERPSTTIAPQALMLMNNPQVRLYARNFARKLQPAAETSWEAAIKAGYQTAIGRNAEPEEIVDAKEFLRQQEQSYRENPEQAEAAKELALADFCQVLFELNEFVYVE